MIPAPARRSGRLALLGVCAALAALVPNGCRRSSPPERPRLDERLAFEGIRQRSPESSGFDRYRVALEAGQLLALRLQQEGIDAEVTLIDPSGQPVARTDSLNGSNGPELLFALARSGGEHWVRVQYQVHASRKKGRYRLSARREGASPATARDAARASREVSEADQRWKNGSPGTMCSARAGYEGALALWRRAGVPEAEALTEARLGTVLARCLQAGNALAHFERAEALRRRLPALGEWPGLQIELGKAYRELGDGVRAERIFSGVRSAARRLGEPEAEAAALNYLGLEAKNAGKSWEALLLFEEARKVFLEVGRKVDSASPLNNRGRLLMELGQVEEAKAALSEALSVYRHHEATEFSAIPASELAWIRALQGDRDGARAGLEQALALHRKAEDRPGEAMTLDRMGSLEVADGHPQAALPLYSAALLILRERADRPNEILTRSNLGEALAQAGDPHAALREVDRALRALTEAPSPASEVFVRASRVKALRALGRLEEARDESEIAVRLLDRSREGAESDALRRTLVDWVHDLYEMRVDLLMEMHAREPRRGYDAEALEAADRSRAQTLLDLVQDQRQRSLGAAGQAVDRLREVERQIRDFELQAQRAEDLSTPTSSDSRRDEGGPFRRLLAERESLLVEIRRGARKGDRPARFLALREMQRQLLDSGTTLLVYSLGESRSFVWAVGRDHLRSAILPSRRVLEAEARRFHELAATGLDEATVGQQRLTAGELSPLLLSPVAASLGSNRLAIVPDGALAFIPFSLLPEPGHGDDPLLLRHEVVILPSVSVLGALRERNAARAPAPRQFAALADPLFLAPGTEGKPGSVTPTHDPALAITLRETARATRDLGMERLAPLPHSRREAEAIAALVRPGQALTALGAEASLELVASGELSNYRTVHFATHALINPISPELSGVVLSLYDRVGRAQPGFLLSYKVLDLRLPAEMVVLSACRTALGQELKGEGFVGLTQSFFHAGASRVLVSLWNVDDEATALLMTRFYEGLYQRRLPPAAALREAQLALHSDPRWSAPFYWAGFELQGDWRRFD